MKLTDLNKSQAFQDVIAESIKRADALGEDFWKIPLSDPSGDPTDAEQAIFDIVGFSKWHTGLDPDGNFTFGTPLSLEDYATMGKIMVEIPKCRHNTPWNMNKKLTGNSRLGLVWHGRKMIYSSEDMYDNYILSNGKHVLIHRIPTIRTNNDYFITNGKIQGWIEQ